MAKILVATKDQHSLETVRRNFEPKYTVKIARNEDTFLHLMGQATKRENSFELVFIDVDFIVDKMDTSSAEELGDHLLSISERFLGTEIVVLCSPDRSKDAIRVVKAGAHDYLISPLNSSKINLLRERIEKRLQQRSELSYLREGFWKRESLKLVETRSPLMKMVLEQVRSVAPTLSTVLLWGETGTGKGVIARLIHSHSSRAHGPFIGVHCGAIPDALIESELFGHERGAFTGADRRKLGKFEIAKGGTIFLDEIGTIAPSAQIKLLQVLQERSFQRVGGEKPISADVRIVAATNEDLLELNREGRFRKDLYFRLNVFPIELPPLRERIEDLGILVNEFLSSLNRTLAKKIGSVDGRVMNAFRK
jgi:DNA-binding NtrC family response regulator